MVKAFKSVQEGDGPCDIPDNPEAIVPLEAECDLSPPPDPSFEFPFEIPLPPPHIFGFGCALPTSAVSTTGPITFTFNPSPGASGDNCFPIFNFDVVVECVDISDAGSAITKDLDPDADPTIDFNINDCSSSDTCCYELDLDIHLPDVTCETPTVTRTVTNGGNVGTFEVTVSPNPTCFDDWTFDINFPTAGFDTTSGTSGVDGTFFGTSGVDGTFFGSSGVDGVDGADGADGAVGPIGPIGPIGPTGPTGPRGGRGAASQACHTGIACGVLDPDSLDIDCFGDPPNNTFNYRIVKVIFKEDCSIEVGGTCDQYQQTFSCPIDGTDGTDGTNAQPEGKSAIVNVGGEWIGFFCGESSEVLFYDRCTLDIAKKESYINVAKELRGACEPNSIFVSSVVGSLPERIGAVVEGDKVVIRKETDDKSIVTVFVAGTRKGFSGDKFPRYTALAAHHNNNFWRQAFLDEQGS